jgi:CMP-N-acetylneuraminic acid synthetase
MKITAIIPARGGSKGIPHKNIIRLAGKPLLSYSVKQALQLREIDRVIVSSDDDGILAIARKYGAEVLKRPSSLATNTAKMDGVIRHALLTFKQQGYVPDFVVLLQPTSPLRKAATVRKAIREFVKHRNTYDSLIPVYKIDGKIGKNVNGRYQPLQRLNMQRQEIEPFYKECGTVFIFKPEIIRNGGLYGKRIYPFIVTNSEETIDIDSFDDLNQAEFYFNRHERNSHKK